jgi:hypothetical protein
MIEIQSNGSKWLGQSPDALEKLFEVLSNHPLRRTMEPFGNFAQGPMKTSDFVYPASEFAIAHVGFMHYSGNFFTVSHVFSIYTDEPDVIERLTTAIRANQQRSDYLEQSTEDPFKASARKEAKGALQRESTL